MHRVRAVLRSLLLGLLWALSVAALCVPLTGAGAAAAAQPGWTRTLPDAGVWLVAAVALAVLYYYVSSRLPLLRHARLWLLAALLAAVAALGESFAQAGTAELALAAPLLTLLYVGGRVPVFYLGMALLRQALEKNEITQPDGGGGRVFCEEPWGGDAALSAEAQSGRYFAGVKAMRTQAEEQPAPGWQAGAVATPPPERCLPRPVAEAGYGPGDLFRSQAGEADGANIYPFPGRGAAPAGLFPAPEGELYDPAMFDWPQDTGFYDAGTAFAPEGMGYPGPQAAQGYTPQPGTVGYGGRYTSVGSRADARAPGHGPATQAADRGRPGHAAAIIKAARRDAAAATRAAGVSRYAPHTGRSAARHTPTWLFMLLLLLCWLPYLLAVWPGTVSNDSITQLAEIFGAKPLSADNPLAQTGLLWVFVQLGLGLINSADAAVALYIGVQGLLMAWLLGYTAARVQRSGAPGWLTGLTVAFFALCPVFPTFAFCVGKDTNFAMAVLWFTLMLWRLIESRWPPLRTTLGLCLSAVLCALLRNAGGYMAVFTLALATGMLLLTRTGRWRAPLLALAFTVGAMLALGLAVEPRLGAAPPNPTENRSMMVQQLARTVASEPLTEAERAAIDAALPVDALKAAYNGELSDPVKALWREGVTDEQALVLRGVWIRLAFKHPATYLSATFHNTYGYLLPGYVSTIKPTFLLGMEGRTTLIDSQFDFSVNPAAETLKTALQSLFAYAPFRLLTAPGLYGCLLLLALAYIRGLKNWRAWLCMLPALLTLLGCLLSAVNGYFRYAMPLYFVAPALLAIAAQTLRGEERARVEALGALRRRPARGGSHSPRFPE